MLRHIPQILSTEKIQHNLIEVGFDVITVSRIHKKIEGATFDIPLILMQLAQKWEYFQPNQTRAYVEERRTSEG